MKHSIAKSIFRLVVAVSVAVLTGNAQAQQETYNYFSRTPESEKILQSNEYHHLNKGIGHLRSGTTTELLYAKNEFDFILNYWPNHPSVLAYQAETLDRLGQPQLIEQYFERAYQITPDAGQLHIAHGVALLRQDKVDEAVKRLQRGVELEENSLNGQYNLGLALVRAKRFKEANHHAQLAYAMGHPLPGLRDQLKRAGAWKPDAAKNASSASSKKAN